MTKFFCNVVYERPQNLLRWRWGFINYAGERNGRTSNHVKFAIVAFDSGPRGYNSEVEDQRMKSRSGRNLEKLEIRKYYVTAYDKTRQIEV